MIEIRKAIQQDLDYIRQNPVEEAIKSYPALTIDDYSKTGLIDGKIVGVGGIVIYWEGMGEGWLILSKDILEHKIEAVRCLRRLMEEAIKDCKLKRLQVTVRTDFPKAKELVESLGFQCEGYMEKYLPDGGDALLYARIIQKEF